MNSRAAILARIARQVGRLPSHARADDAASADRNVDVVDVHSSQKNQADGLRPVEASAHGSTLLSPEEADACITRFTALAAATQMTVARVAAPDAVPAAVLEYLRAGAMAPGIVIDPTLRVDTAQWDRAGLSWTCGDTRADGDVYVSAGLAAIAECGAVVLASGQERALRNDFLARTHIVVVAADRLLPGFADLWALLRRRPRGELLPRTFCLITGPSRTADLGVPAKLGAHGPARVHVLLLGS